MSYDLDHIEKHCPCPCGKGKIVYGSGTNDWNQIREGMMEIWCENCNKKYRFSRDGLLPIDYPEYQGDENAREEMSRLSTIISNYHGWGAFRFWSDDLLNKRLHLYLTEEEIAEDKKSKYRENWVMAITFAKELADNYTLKELKGVQKQLSECKFSTQLTGIAVEITERHRRIYKTVKLSKVIIPVNMAIRNYETYKEADKEDEAYISMLKEELKKAETIYYKDYEKYEEDRKKHLISYELKDVR